MTPQLHVPVLVERVVQLLAPALQRPGSVCIDATLGLGGHTEAVLETCPEARVIGLDRDPMALAEAQRRLAPFGDRITFVHTVYDAIAEVAAEHGAVRPSDRPKSRPSDRASDRTGGRPGVDAVLFDLGVSSLQLDVVDRGFSYAQDAPLDMRMDSSRGRTAAELVNTADERELAFILRTYGEERFASRIARAIVRERARAPFDTSSRLVDLVRDAVPAATRRTGGHPAKRTFQALRIAVNDELAALRSALPAAVDVTFVGGRIVVLAYHSLEDRIAKRELASRARADVPDDMPVIPAGHGPELRLLTRGAEQATPEQIAANPRARSVRLRAAERIREVA